MLTVNKKFTIVRLLCAFAIAIALSVAVIFAVSEEPVTAIYNLFLGPLQSKRHFFEVFASPPRSAVRTLSVLFRGR